jgi:tRNA dimethylallyltransferase
MSSEGKGSASSEIGAVLIAGPTASGKSALAIALARALGGAAINADSMQVYRDLRTITARPSVEEERLARHLLYGSVDGGVNFSVGRYLAAVKATLAGLEPGVLPIFVGGTGLYFKALTEGLSAVPAVPEEVRQKVRRESEAIETPALHEILAKRDSQAAASLRPSDRLRVQRALEVIEATGRPLASFHGRREPGVLAGRATVKVFLDPDRTALRERIDRRFLAMMDEGALDEVRSLGARNLDPMLPVMRAHGVPGLLAHLRGEIGLDKAIGRGQADTRRYAKRQFTWFRHQLTDWMWVTPEAAQAAVMRCLSDRPGR